jgi:hypothetical protein
MSKVAVVMISSHCRCRLLGYCFLPIPLLPLQLPRLIGLLRMLAADAMVFNFVVVVFLFLFHVNITVQIK